VSKYASAAVEVSFKRIRTHVEARLRSRLSKHREMVALTLFRTFGVQESRFIPMLYLRSVESNACARSREVYGFPFPVSVTEGK
jgi:hypothetical protein